MQLCHWTLLLEYRYYCADRNLMRCDTTSPFFVSRAKHFPLLDNALLSSAPLLAHLDFFHKLKHRRGPKGPPGPPERSNAAVVVTAMDEQVSF